MTSILSSPAATTVQSVKTAPAAPASPLLASQYKRKTMSITQTYYLAHKARGKLSSEAARPDHNLRLLVGHANLLDSLMLELADAEREQESWFNQSVRGASSSKAEDRHVQWADAVVEDPEEDWQAEDADSDSSSDSDSDISEDEEDDIEMVDVIPLTRLPSKTLASPTPILVDDFEDDDEEEDFAALTLTRSPSHSAHPPELDHDSDSSEDESMPPSPPTTVLPTFAGKQEQEVTVSEKTLYDDGYYLPDRTPTRLVSAISVY